MSAPKATPDNSKFNNKKVIPKDAGEKGVAKARETYAKDADKPTTAAADPKLRLPEALQQVDPKMISQVLPDMYKKLKSIRDLMRVFNTKNGGGGGSNSSPGGYARSSIVDVFTGALARSVDSFDYFTVLSVLFAALDNNKYKNITTDYQSIVFEAIIELIKKAEEFGETNIPFSTVPAITYGSTVPTPLYTSYDQVPDEYIQQYYSAVQDPYPGYIEWQSPDGGISVYIRRTVNNPPFESAQEETFTTAELSFASDLAPYFRDANLKVLNLDPLLIKYCTQVSDNMSEKSMGKNSKKNLSSMLSSLSGLAGTLAQATETLQLPNSVLDVSSVMETLNKHKEEIGKIKKLKEFSSGAFNPMGMLNSSEFSKISSLFSTVKSGGSVQSKVEAVVSNIKSLSNVIS